MIIMILVHLLNTDRKGWQFFPPIFMKHSDDQDQLQPKDYQHVCKKPWLSGKVDFDTYTPSSEAGRITQETFLQGSSFWRPKTLSFKIILILEKQFIIHIAC